MQIHKKTSLFDHQPPRERENIKVVIEVRVMSLIRIA